MKVFTERKPLRCLLEDVRLVRGQPAQPGWPKTRMERGTRPLVDRLFIELCSQLSGGAAGAGILPGEQGHELAIRGIDPDNAMPEGIGCYHADLRCQWTSG